MRRVISVLAAGFAAAAGVVGLGAGPASAGPCEAGPANGDARIRKIGDNYIGQGVFNCNGDNQRYAEDVNPNDLPLTFKYQARVKNTTSQTRRINLRASVNGDDVFVTKFFKGDKNITNRILTEGRSFGNIAAGESTPPITIKIRANTGGPPDAGMDMFFWGVIGSRSDATGDNVNVDVDTEI